jgi:hypothetical protein
MAKVNRISLGLLAVVLSLTGCSTYRTTVEQSPDTSKSIRISHYNRWGCGSDGCMTITLVNRGYETEVARETGFFACFATVSWSKDSTRAAILVQGCYGSAVAFVLDVGTKRKSPLRSTEEVWIKDQLKARHGVEIRGDLYQWIRSEEARVIYSQSLSDQK